MKDRILLASLVLVSCNVMAQQRLEVEDIITTAISKNYDIRVEQNNYQASSTSAKNAVGLFLPDVTLTGTRTWNKQDQKQILANDTQVERKGVPSNNLGGNAQLSWTIFDGAKMFATHSRLQEIESQGEWLVKDRMTATIADVIANYYGVVAEKQQLKAITEQISVAEERVKLAERKLQVGTGGKPELLQAKVDLNAFRVAALQQEVLIKQLKEQLNGLSGLQLPDEYDVSDTIPLNMGMSMEEIIQGIEETNPRLIAARMNINIANFALRERRGDRYPVVNLVTNYNFTRTKNQIAINNFTTLFDQRNGYTYGATLSLPILNNFTVKNNVQLAVIERDRQQLLYEQQKMLATVGVKVAYAAYDNARKTLEIEEENILYARENVTIMFETFKRGATTFVELRTAQQSIVDAYNRLATARYNAKVSETELLRLKGSLLK